MPESYRAQREQFVAVLTEESTRRKPKMDADERLAHILTLMRSASTLHRLACDKANHGLTRAQERTVDNVRKRVEQDAKALGCKVGRFGTDPRGAMVTIKLPSGRTNDWVNSGWCVPQMPR